MNHHIISSPVCCCCLVLKQNLTFWFYCPGTYDITQADRKLELLLLLRLWDCGGHHAWCFVLVWIFETGSHSEAEAGLELGANPSVSASQVLNYRREPSHLAGIFKDGGGLERWLSS